VRENQDSTRRWNGYVCPDCRFVFRVARDHDGRGLVCPSCRRLLKIPRPGDPVPALLAPAPVEEESKPTAVDSIAPDTPEPLPVKRRHNRGEKPEWAPSGQRREAYEEPVSEGRGMAWMAGLSLVGLLAVLLVVILLKHDDPKTPPVAARPTAAAPATGNPAETAARSPAALMADAQPVIEKFMTARTVAELLEVVDAPAVVAERIARLAPDGTLDAPGLGETGHFSQWEAKGIHVTLPVRTKDYEFRLLTLRDGPDGVKVDWESWAGWSDVPWDRFGADEASSSGAFRVVMKPVEYYNYHFTDERKWQSYQLESPDGMHSLYGYVDRGSALDLDLQAAMADQGAARIILELRYPEGPRGRGQARIERKISDDWIDPERKQEP
jgi:hypothetical protein